MTPVNGMQISGESDGPFLPNHASDSFQTILRVHKAHEHRVSRGQHDASKRQPCSMKESQVNLCPRRLLRQQFSQRCVNKHHVLGIDTAAGHMAPDRRDDAQFCVRHVQTVLMQFALPSAPHAIPDDYYATARDVHLPALWALLAGWFADNRVDAMLLPATMGAATPIGAGEKIRIADIDVPFSTVMGRNIAPGSTSGLPGLALPAGLADGLPVAIELDGPAGTDRQLLGIGLAIEAMLGALRPPAW
jgi:hypothetical protein